MARAADATGRGLKLGSHRRCSGSSASLWARGAKSRRTRRSRSWSPMRAIATAVAAFRMRPNPSLRILILQGRVAAGLVSVPICRRKRLRMLVNTTFAPRATGVSVDIQSPTESPPSGRFGYCSHQTLPEDMRHTARARRTECNIQACSQTAL